MSPSQNLGRSPLRHSAVPFVAPFAVFVAFTAAQGSLPGGVLWIYPVKTAVTAAVLVAVWRALPPLEVRHTLGSVLVGLTVFVVWVLPEGRYPLLGPSEAFDPFTALDPPGVYLWIGVRLLGATLVVGVMEELFWRGFLLRWLVSSDFRAVALGTFTWTSFLVTTGLFALEHNRWLVGLAAGVAYNLWFYRTKSLYACVVAHATTNLALGVYVLATRSWTFW